MISVIIPTYNEEENIEKCLLALEKQTLQRHKYEIIVVDGQSKDRTVEIAKKYADKVVMQKNKWIAGARNDGVDAADYGIVACTDADCIVPEYWLEEIRKSLVIDDVVAVFGPVTPPKNARISYRILFNFLNKMTYALSRFNISYQIYTSCFGFKKKAFLKIGGFEEITVGEDYEIGLRLRKQGKIIFNKKMNVIYDIRRYQKYGTVNLSLIMLFNILKISIGLKPNDKINYAKQNYEGL